MIYLVVMYTLFLSWAAFWIYRKIRARAGRRDWPKTEATIETSAREVVASHRGVEVTLPVFGFSYKVGGDRFGGRFALLPYTTDPPESILQTMIGRKISVLYDPKSPGAWIVPDDMMEGCKVEQKLDPRLMDYSPRD